MFSSPKINTINILVNFLAVILVHIMLFKVEIVFNIKFYILFYLKLMFPFSLKHIKILEGRSNAHL